MAPSPSKRASSPRTRRLVVRVDLAGAKPPIWRRLELDERLALSEVHIVLQTAFDWDDSHMHEFVLGADPRGDVRRFAPAIFELDEGYAEEVEDPSRTSLGDVLRKPGDRMDYIYDFGDDWTHLMTVEKVVERSIDDPPARCLAGRRASPPEDCGGIWQYQAMMEIGLDPDHPDHDEARDWMEWAFDGEQPDPAAFDVAAMDQKLIALSRQA